MMKKEIQKLVILAATALVLSACGGKESENKSEQTITEANTDEANTTETKTTEKETAEKETTEMITTEQENMVTETVTSTPKFKEQSVSDPTGNYIVVTKSDRELTLYNAAGEELAQYPVGLAQNPVGAKEKEGDKKTPEGEYYICVKNDSSKFHKALGLSYPNIQDAQRGLKEGLISQEQLDGITAAINAGEKPDWYTSLGGEIMIHGQKGNLGSQSDWTTGCIAVNNDVIDALWDQVQKGTKVTIKP